MADGRPSSSKKRRLDSGALPNNGDSLFGEMPIPSSARSHGRPKQAGGTVYSCLPCRKRKTKCDKLQPCTRCVERKESSKCVPIQRDEEPKLTGYVQISDYNALFNRVSQIDLALSRVITQSPNPSSFSDLVSHFTGPLPTLRGWESSGSSSRRREGLDHNGRGRGGAGVYGDRESGRSGSEDGEGEMDEEDEEESKEGVDEARNPTRRRRSPSEVINEWGLRILSEATLDHQQQLEEAHHHPDHATDDTPTQHDDLDSTHNQNYNHNHNHHNHHHNQNTLSIPPTHTSPTNTYTLSQNQNQNHNQNQKALEIVPPIVPVPPRERGPDTRLGNEGLDGEFSAALHLEDLILGRTGNFPRTLPEDQSSAFIQHTESNETQMAGGLPKRETVRLSLPDVGFAKVVMGYYVSLVGEEGLLEDLLYLDRIVHRPSFDLKCQQLWSRPTNAPTTLEDAAFITLYMACLIIGLWSMGSRSLRSRLGLTLEGAEKLVVEWQGLFISAQERSDWMQAHSIYPIQALIVIYPYMISVGRSEHYWSLTGAAIRVAQSLRLHDIPDETKVMLPVTGRWKSAIDREVGRRVWRSLVEIDHISIGERGYEPSVPAKLRERSMPIHLNDADLHADGLALARPRNEYTDMSFVLGRFDMLKALAVCLYKTNAERLNYNLAIEAHQNILQLKQDLPPFYANLDIARRLLPEGRSRLVVKEALSIQTILASKFLTLHRPFFSMSFRDPKYLTSYQTTTQSAFDIINLLAKADELDDGAMYFAPRACTAFAATVTLILDFCHTLDRGRAEVVERGIRQGITLLQHARPRGNLGKGADVCSALLAKELERRNVRPPAVPPTIPNGGPQQQGQADDALFAEPWLLDENAFAEMMTYFAPDGSLMDMWTQGGRPM